ncbi:hypothetical protein CHS0354_024402 [Potamilus streckersoni]|uniref:Uncharacterized protein n=1 Tax=Potamilus streckersoni TaxID=2493646 RepID=A0AAE0SVV7_9BIVA|nr:hypothetical protein CHS0354_024402 [Potamilus streckersoni]
MGRNSDKGLYICFDKIGNIRVYICFILTIFPIYCFSFFPNDDSTNIPSDSRISNAEWFVHESNRTQATTKQFSTNFTSTINISNNTTPDYVYTKSSNDTEADEKGKYPDGQNSSLNLAIIPCIAIIIIVIALCMVCHKLFVRYLRKGTKEVSGSSYIIVEEDDDDFNKVEITSDSASSSYYDTVSSFCSYLRKSVYDSMTSSRSIKFNSQQHDTVCFKPSFQQTLHSIDKDSQGDINNTENIGPQRKRITSYSEFDADVSSKSSDDFKDSKPFPSRDASTELDSLDDENENMPNDSKTQRRMQRFKVSFVTEDEMRSLCSKQSKGVTVYNHKQSILKPASTETHYNAVSPINSPQKDNQTGNKEGWIMQLVDNDRVGVSKFRTTSSRAIPEMVDVSTQTVRTIAWKRRRCKSESDSPKKNPLSMTQPDAVKLVLDQNPNGVVDMFDLNGRLKSGGIRRIPLLQKSQSISGEASADCVLECYRLSDAVVNSSENQSFYVPDEVAIHSNTNGCKSVDLRNVSNFSSAKDGFVSDICMHYRGKILETACIDCAQRSDTTQNPDFSYINPIGSKGFPSSACSLCKDGSQKWLHNDGKICFCDTVSVRMVETLGPHTCVHSTNNTDESFAQTDTTSCICSKEQNNFRLHGTCLERQALYQNSDDISCNTSISSGYIDNSSESISS